MNVNSFIKHAVIVATVLLTGAAFAGRPGKLDISAYLSLADEGKIQVKISSEGGAFEI